MVVVVVKVLVITLQTRRRRSRRQLLLLLIIVASERNTSQRKTLNDNEKGRKEREDVAGDRRGVIAGQDHGHTARRASVVKEEKERERTRYRQV